MGFGNSNNWQTEATLRNQRQIKQASLDKLLEHVNWDSENLTLTLSGITLKWGDIEGADNVAMKSDIPSDEYITQITENSIKTATIQANQINLTGAITWNDLDTASQNKINGAVSDASSALEAAGKSVKYTEIDGSKVITDTFEASNLYITGGTIKLESSTEDYSFIQLKSSYVTSTFSPNNFTIANNNGRRTIINATGITLDAGGDKGRITLSPMSTGDATLNGYTIMTENNVADCVSQSGFVKSSALSNYVKRKNNGFSQATNPSSMMCIVDGEIKYIVRSALKSWLGIS